MAVSDPLVHRVRGDLLAHRLVARGDRGVVALSGGQDSLTLLHVLRSLAEEFELGLEAVVVDHGLRVNSAREAAAAAALAAQMGTAASVVPVVVPRGGNTQEAARAARLDALAQHAGARWVALGHTASDQAETVLMRLLRGSGSRGLAAMAWRRDRFIRPLLGVTRQQVARYIARHRLRPLVDPTNAEPTYQRNRVRTRILPLMERENPDAVAALARSAEVLGEEHRALEWASRELLSAAGWPGELALTQLEDLPHGMLARVVRTAHCDVVGTTRHLSREHVARVVALCSRRHGSASVDLPGARVERRYDRLLWSTEPRQAASPWQPVTVVGPGEVVLGDGRRARIDEDDVRGRLSLSAGAAPFPWLLRPPRCGDRIAIGPRRSKTVARVLQEARVPRVERARAVVVQQGDRVVLVVGVRRSWDCGAAQPPHRTNGVAIADESRVRSKSYRVTLTWLRNDASLS